VNDQVTGDKLVIALERLRQLARIDTPRAASEYAGVAGEVANTSGPDETAFAEDADFGLGKLKTDWCYLRDIIWAGTGESGNHLWEIAEGLDLAVDVLSEEDGATGADLDRQRDKLEGNGDTSTDEWTGDYEKPELPEWKPPGSGE